MNHRDIKLENILVLDEKCDVTKDFTLLLSDFGESNEAITKGLETMVRATRKEEEGVGTPDYMSPEIYQAVFIDKKPIILNND